LLGRTILGGHGGWDVGGGYFSFGCGGEEKVDDVVCVCRLEKGGHAVELILPTLSWAIAFATATRTCTMQMWCARLRSDVVFVTIDGVMDGI
jgi:hypothetical protein